MMFDLVMPARYTCSSSLSLRAACDSVLPIFRVRHGGLCSRDVARGTKRTDATHTGFFKPDRRCCGR
jgi:hypothetical protein